MKIIPRKFDQFPAWFLTFNLKEMFIKLIAYQIKNRLFKEAAVFIFAAIKEFGCDFDFLELIVSSDRRLSRDDRHRLDMAFKKEYKKRISAGSINDLIDIYFFSARIILIYDITSSAKNFMRENVPPDILEKYFKGNDSSTRLSQIDFRLGFVKVLSERIRIRHKKHQNISLELKELKNQLCVTKDLIKLLHFDSVRRDEAGQAIFRDKTA
jgi:hypothetical protein